MQTALSLDQLLAAVAAGDREAWARLDHLLRADLLRSVRRLTPDASAAEDIVQETLVRIRERAERFQARDDHLAEAAARRWCVTLAVNLALDHRRRDGRRSSLASRQGAPGTTHESPERSLEVQETRQILVTGLAELPAAMREALILHYLDGWSRRRVAEYQAVSEATVHTRVWRGLRKLRRSLHRHGLRANLAWLLAVLAEALGKEPPPAPTAAARGTESGLPFVPLALTVAAALAIAVAMLWHRPPASDPTRDVAPESTTAVAPAGEPADAAAIVAAVPGGPALSGPALDPADAAAAPALSKSLVDGTIEALMRRDLRAVPLDAPLTDEGHLRGRLAGHPVQITDGLTGFHVYDLSEPARERLLTAFQRDYGAPSYERGRVVGWRIFDGTGMIEVEIMDHPQRTVPAMLAVWGIPDLRSVQ